MKALQYHIPLEFNKSFNICKEEGPFFPCPWHYHSEFELVLINKSTGVRQVGDHVGYFQEGDLVFMGPSIPHLWMNDPQYFKGMANLRADATVIHFAENFLGIDFFNLPEIEPIKNLLRLSKQGMVITGNSRSKIAALMEEMPNMSGIKRLTSMLTIFDILCESKEYELLASPGYLKNGLLDCSDKFRKVNTYILRNFDHDITLNDVASVANMAVSTFCNYFKEHYRVTFVEYLTKVRIGHACKLLAELEENIVEIAYKCGFNNLANFNRQFRKIKNMTPSEYRRTSNINVPQVGNTERWLVVSSIPPSQYA
ncbi:AraC family transcriptional regulator [Daejeonella sp.]|uniref:AraC family transcriptional regulator n=1 Tax=Daejeonella sp. TaxID=2805397 RepID=UPI0030C04717